MAWLLYIAFPNVPGKIKAMCPRGNWMLDNAYGFDRFNEVVFQEGTKKIGHFFTQKIDIKIIDTGMVKNTFMAVFNSSQTMRLAQTGYLYHYAFVMIISLLFMLAWVLW